MTQVAGKRRPGVWASVVLRSTEKPRGLELTVTRFEPLCLSMLLQTMEENCTLRPCATDFSIAAIMARHDRRARSKQQDSADTLSPLGRQSAVRHCTRHMPHDGHYNIQREITHPKTCFNFQVRQTNFFFSVLRDRI